MPKPEPRPLRTLPERAFRARARLVAALLCCVCFAGLAARLAYLQLFTGSWYTSRALGQQLRDTVVPADRGRIYSADGALLAANSSCWTLRASPREMPEEKLSLAADGLAEILELDEAALLEKFSDRRSNDCLLRYRVERDTADRVRDFCEANGITGIRINQDSKRWYPQGEFLASVLGFTNVDNAGVSGLELRYNEVLTGQNGVVLTAVNAWGYTLEQSYETERVPLEGSGLRLTIDASIQHYLENALTMRHAVLVRPKAVAAGVQRFKNRLICRIGDALRRDQQRAVPVGSEVKPAALRCQCLHRQAAQQHDGRKQQPEQPNLFLFHICPPLSVQAANPFQPRAARQRYSLLQAV